jgi:hypothetical protein
LSNEEALAKWGIDSTIETFLKTLLVLRHKFDSISPLEFPEA